MLASSLHCAGSLAGSLYNHRIADPPTSLVEYDKRLSARPAYQRAAEATWPADRT